MHNNVHRFFNINVNISTRLKNKVAIVVDEDIIEETKSENLLDVIISDKLSWKEHFHGDSENEGLTTQLNIKIGKVIW